VTAVRLPGRAVAAWLSPRAGASHKGDFGHVLVAAGSRGMMGAARLAALGALRAGAGLVTMAVPESEYAIAASGPWEAMTFPLPSADGAIFSGAAAELADFVSKRGVTAVALGPGLSGAAGPAQFALEVLDFTAVPVVADADALNALAVSGKVPARTAPWILTPHPGEAARLLGISSADVQKDRLRAAKELARRFGATVVLKGRGTVVTDGKKSFVNTTGNPGMSSGGMGDVLTGVVAALIGQVGPDPEACLRAAATGAWLHGRAGDLAARKRGPVGILASEVAGFIPSALGELL
jgi:NAD(P)H-hydrate epimerase